MLWVQFPLVSPFNMTTNTRPEFEGFKKIGRLSKECIVTEKLDGTNAQVYITEEGDIFVGSRNRWITPTEDNFGFAKWVEGNKETLLKLGPGRHYGEWWGKGIAIGYGLNEKRFSLFNVHRWNDTNCPDGIHVVPILYTGKFDTIIIENLIKDLRTFGSVAATGWPRPEGIVIFHTGNGCLFKKFLENDDIPKTPFDKIDTSRL